MAVTGSQIVYPLVNGVRYSFSELSILVGNISPTAGIPAPNAGTPSAGGATSAPIPVPFVGVKSINYHGSMKRTKVRGTSPLPIGRTRGVYEASGKIDLYRVEFDALCAILQQIGGQGTGWMEATFNLQIQYRAGALLPLITDVLVGCQIDEDSHDGNAGSSDPLVVALNLDVMWKGRQLTPGGPIVCDIGGLDALAASTLTVQS